MATGRKSNSETKEGLTFGERLQHLRHLKGDTQKSLAKKLYVCTGSVSFYEQGITAPSISMLESICRLYSVSADYLLGLTDTIERKEWKNGNV